MWVFFFFQAEDGIRDLVRSRGLGDVYKRQALAGDGLLDEFEKIALVADPGHLGGGHGIATVSYTHLTLPTSDLV